MRKVFLIVFILGMVLVEFNNVAANDFIVPGPTAADRRGQKAIMDQIRWLENAGENEGCFINVVSVRPKGRELSTFVEHWTVNVCDQKRIYKVRISGSGFDAQYKVTFPMPAELLD